MEIDTGYTLEIHHINVGAGDATAIIVKNSHNDFISKVLIDAGAEGSGFKRLAAYVKQYLTGKTSDEPFDYIIASHYHNDHIDGFRFCKLYFKNYIDIGGYLGTQEFNPINGTGLAKTPKYFVRYRDYLSEYGKKNAATRQEILFITQDEGKYKSGELKILLGGMATGITLTCYCANGILADGTNALKNQKGEKRNQPYDPNDLSLAFMLEWGDFRYFTAGDLTGDTTLGSYYNIEKPLVAYLLSAKGPLNGGKPITILKVDHHGSEFSTYQDGEGSFLTALNPEVLIVPCNTRKQVPSPVFLTAANKYCATKKAPILFVNDLYYPKQDKDRYPTLDSIKTNLISNLEYDNMESPSYISSLQTNAIIIRRTSIPTTSKDVETLDDEDTQRIPLEDGKSYEILINTRKLTEEDLKQAEGRINTYLLVGPIDADLEAGIMDGFGSQAKDLAEWLALDKDQSSTAGIDFIKEWFPSLEEVADTADALKTAMTDLFNRGYRKETVLATGTQFFAAQFGTLKLDDRQTLYYLMYKNKYQVPVNRKWIPGRNLWNPKNAWNEGADPYVPIDDETVTDDRGEDKRPPKRGKTTVG